jgi:hypothetical protein
LSELEFSGQIFEKSSNFTKILPVGSKLFHADGQRQAASLIDGQTDRETDTTKLIVAFRNFANVLEILISGVDQLG